MLIHMIGICGTGMGALAGLLKDAGHQVQGSDENVYPPVSTMLEARGIPILEGFRASHIQKAEPAPDLVIVGNVVGRGNPEVVALLESGIDHISMPQALARFFLSSRHPIVVAGTHGKTTTTALIASMLLDSGRDPSFLVGGVLGAMGRSFRLGGGETFVIEGDEYETSFNDKGSKFLHYMPKTAILTSVEYDHAEMFPTMEAVRQAFSRFVLLVPPAEEGGRLIVCSDDPVALELSSPCRGEVVTYGLAEGADLVGRTLDAGPSGQIFEVSHEGGRLGEFRLALTGDHNLRNALSAVAAGRHLGLSIDEIRSGLASFEGVRRRQEVRGISGGVTVMDDFAHHPTAVRETVAAIKARYPGQRVWAVFEPRTNTSRRDVFQSDYARSFDAADEVLIAPVDHPERAPEGRRLDVERLIADLLQRGVHAESMPGGVDQIVTHLKARTHRGDVILVMSNGGFGGIHDRLLAAFETRGQGVNPARTGS